MTRRFCIGTRYDPREHNISVPKDESHTMPSVSLPHTELDGPLLSADTLHPYTVPVYTGLHTLAQGVRAHLLTHYPVHALFAQPRTAVRTVLLLLAVLVALQTSRVFLQKS